MLDPMDSDEWRSFSSQHRSSAECFYMGDTCPCHGTLFAEFVREGKGFNTASNEGVSDPLSDGQLIDETVRRAIVKTWAQGGGRGVPQTGERVTVVEVGKTKVFAASDGPIGYINDDGGMHVTIFPHLITALWSAG